MSICPLLSFVCHFQLEARRRLWRSQPQDVVNMLAYRVIGFRIHFDIPLKHLLAKFRMTRTVTSVSLLLQELKER